jgi:hypothetical protein
VTYTVCKTIHHAGIGLTRQPGEFVRDEEIAAVPGWRDALLAEQAIMPMTGLAPAEKRKAAKHAVS